ncbi:hypothetical protein ACOSQ3_026238 [Xanthoceras sorbifolium]
MAATNIITDQSALLAMKSHISYDPQNILATNWSTSASVCSWRGVSCGKRHHRVTALDLSDMEFTGTIPPELGSLSFLVFLSLYNNSFHGSLPKELANLRRLKYLNLANNNFNGEIPSWIGSLITLQSLFLFGNSFRGSVPSSLSYLSKLETLDLYNNLLQGNVPEEIGKLPSLKTFYLDQNQLSGSIPSSIFNISSLQLLDFSNNHLSGFIPSPTLNMSSLKIIDFSTNNLTGPLPSDMFDHLPELEEIYLTWNQFFGSIPSSLFSCQKLRILSLSHNHFEGTIPEQMGNLTMLNQLFLGLNNFTGEIPRQIGELKGLHILSLIQNSLTGTLPSEIGNLTQLKLLDLSYNSLTGTIPSVIGSLHNLETLSLGINRITGLIPPKIFNVSTMINIAISANYLSGNLPSSTGLWLPNLKQLILGQNELTGPIPSSISNASQLVTLELSLNSFSGFIPDELGNLRNLQRLHLARHHLTSRSSSPELSLLSSLTNCKKLTSLVLYGNPLNGTLPVTIGNLSTALQALHLYESNIKGSIPGEIGNLSNLTSLNLENNELTRILPTTIGRLIQLQYLSLRNNKLQGSIPSELCHLENLAFVYLTGNNLMGSIPSCLGNLSSLRTLSLASNRFNSTIESTLWGLRDILHINLSTNSLSGSLPSVIGNLKVLIELDLSRNQLTGDIPVTIGDLIELKRLSLADRFQGSIPQSFGNMISVELVDLSSNSLSRAIPKSLEALLYLIHLNVSFNSLEGEVPSGGPFVNFSSLSFMGNQGLCGQQRMQLPPCKSSTSQRSNTTAGLVLNYILPVTLSTILILILIIVCLKWHKKNANQPSQEESLHLETWRRISYQELDRATNGFSESNFLGSGSVGSVYRGTLPDGVEIAVKVFNLQAEKALKSFETECEIMGSIRHRNLTKIISSCSSGDFKALVLEFMPNESLEMLLYSYKKILDLQERLNIMIDVASALEYLHHGYTSIIVHCDLKPSNVLLDEDLVAHVSDFGLAKLLGGGDSVTQTMTLATIGYMAPEFGSEGIVSTKGDVYSYGILLMETFTGKKPTDEIFVGEMNLKRWVGESLSGDSDAVIQVVDDNLLSRNHEDFEAKKDCLISIMQLSLKCSADSHEERMDMGAVLARLNKIKVKFLKDAHSCF